MIAPAPAREPGATQSRSDSDVCCLAWKLTKSTELSIEVDQLTALHSEMEKCVDLVGAKV